MKLNTHFLKHFLFLQFTLLLAVYSCSKGKDDFSYPAEIDERIALTENALLPWVDTGDSTAWNLYDRMKHYRINGLTVGVINNFTTEWIKCYGYADRSEERPVNRKTLFQAASVSKSLNAAAVLRLASEGLADTSADINSILKDWKLEYQKGDKGKSITLLSLLSHTSGLSLFGYNGYPRGSELPTLTETLNGSYRTTSAPPHQLFAPGERFFYSSAGIMIVQKALSDITGYSYEKLMRKEILRPLGMNNSYYLQPPPSRFSKTLATGYDRKGDEIPGKYFIYPELAAVGLWTNAEDLCKYVAETCRAYNGLSTLILDSAMTRKRLVPVKAESGLGYFITKRGDSEWFWHNGGSKGFTCIITGNAVTGDGAVIMLNSENGEIMDEILASVATVYEWKGYLSRERRKVVHLPGNIAGKYIGEYDSGADMIVIKQMKGKLFIGNEEYERELHFSDDSTAFVMEQKSSVIFKSRMGEVSGLSLNGRPYFRIL